MIDSKEGDFAALKTTQSEKSVAELESEFNDLRAKTDFDNMVLRPDGTSGIIDSTEVVEDPTLPGAGSDSEHVVRDAKEKEAKLYGEQIQRYRWIESMQSKTHANEWLRRMKAIDALPRDFDIALHLDVEDED